MSICDQYTCNGLRQPKFMNDQKSCQVFFLRTQLTMQRIQYVQASGDDINQLEIAPRVVEEVAPRILSPVRILSDKEYQDPTVVIAPRLEAAEPDHESSQNGTFEHSQSFPIMYIAAGIDAPAFMPKYQARRYSKTKYSGKILFYFAILASLYGNVSHMYIDPKLRLWNVMRETQKYFRTMQTTYHGDVYIGTTEHGVNPALLSLPLNYEHILEVFGDDTEPTQSDNESRICQTVGLLGPRERRLSEIVDEDDESTFGDNSISSNMDTKVSLEVASPVMVSEPVRAASSKKLAKGKTGKIKKWLPVVLRVFQCGYKK